MLTITLNITIFSAFFFVFVFVIDWIKLYGFGLISCTPWGMKFVKTPDFMTTQFKISILYFRLNWIALTHTHSIFFFIREYVCVHVNKKKMDFVNCFKQTQEKLEEQKKWLNFIDRLMKFVQLLRRRRGNRRRKRRKTKSIAWFQSIFYTV